MTSEAEFLAGAFSGDGDLVIARDSPKAIELWSPDGRARRLISRFPGTLSALRGDGRYVAVRDENAVWVLEVGPNATRLEPVLTESLIGAPVFEPTVVFGGDLVALWRPEALLIGDLRKGTWQDGIPFAGTEQHFAFTESGFVALADGDLLGIWRIDAGPRAEGLRRVPNLRLKARALSFQPGTSRLAALLDSGDIEVGDASDFSQRRVKLPRVRTDAADFLFWNRGYLIAGSGNWIELHPDSDLSQTPFVFEAPSIGDFAIRGDKVAVRLPDAVVLLDLVPVSEDLASMPDASRRKIVCSRAGRDLTREEWTVYLGDRKYEPLCGQ